MTEETHRLLRALRRAADPDILAFPGEAGVRLSTVSSGMGPDCMRAHLDVLQAAGLWRPWNAEIGFVKREGA